MLTKEISVVAKDWYGSSLRTREGRAESTEHRASFFVTRSKLSLTFTQIELVAMLEWFLER